MQIHFLAEAVRIKQIGSLRSGRQGSEASGIERQSDLVAWCGHDEPIVDAIEVQSAEQFEDTRIAQDFGIIFGQRAIDGQQPITGAVHAEQKLSAQ